MVLLLLVILAVLIWMIQRELEPAKRAEGQPVMSCPACQRAIDIDMMVCPHCRQQLRQACPSCHCSKLISHRYCPYCGSTEGEAAK